MLNVFCCVLEAEKFNLVSLVMRRYSIFILFLGQIFQPVKFSLLFNNNNLLQNFKNNHGFLFFQFCESVVLQVHSPLVRVQTLAPT